MIKKHIITTEIEHKCVLSSCRELSSTPFQISENESVDVDVTYLPVSKDGLIDLDELRNAIRPDT